MNCAANPWAELADRQMASPAKARQRAAERRAAADKERAALQKAWRAWRHERIAELLSGPYGEAAQALRGFLNEMRINDGPALVAAVEAGPWRDADSDTRHEILAIVDLSIILLREKSGLPPFSDALPFSDEPPTVFEIIREALR
jgi:hypothetical protein